MVYSFANARNEKLQLDAEAVRESRKKIRGIPVASALASARQAIRIEQGRLKRWQEETGVKNDSKGVYNRYTGLRFLFYEYFQSDSDTEQLFDALPLINSDSDWASAPDSSATRLLPPQSVMDAIFDAEELRNVSTGSMIAFTTGAGTDTPVEVATRHAHRELLLTLARDRRHLKGYHLMESDARAAQRMAMHGSTILSAAYGAQSGVTFVGSDDVLWSCMRYGSAARLALRHLPVFSEAPTDTDSKTVANYWVRKRRMMVEQFAKAWLAEANRVVADSQSIAPVPSYYTMRNAIRRFARVVTIARHGNIHPTQKLSLIHI